jgi:hypothetical protein
MSTGCSTSGVPAVPPRQDADLLGRIAVGKDYDRSVDEGLDAVASVVGSCLDMDRLMRILKEGLD